MIQITPAVQLTEWSDSAFRGISSQQYDELGRRKCFEPREPLCTPAEVIALFARNIPVEHVLSIKTKHFVSCTFQERIAIYYATNGGKQDGYLVKIKLPSIRVVQQAGVLVVYEGSDGTQWIDPRYLIAPNFFGWQKMQARARVDDEILLSGGRVLKVNIRPVRKEEWDDSFLPWAELGEHLQIF